MTDQISFPPLLDLSSGELNMEKERLLSRIAHRPAPVFSRRAVAAVAIAATAATAVALALVFSIGDTRPHVPPPSVRPPVQGGPGVQNAFSVSDLNAANAVLPFTAVFPSGVTPTGIQVDTSGQISTSGLPTAPAWGLQAHFDTTDVGSYMLSEWTSDVTTDAPLQRGVPPLQQWVAETCGGCASQVVTEDGVPVEVLASSIFGLHLYWLRGDGTSSPVATELDWSTDMPAHNVVPSQEAALAIAGDIIRQGG